MTPDVPQHALTLPAELSGLVERFDHLALAVNDVRRTLPLLGFLGATYRTGGHHRTQRFRWVQFDLAAGPKLELLQPLDPDDGDSFLVRFLAANGEGPHHVTFKVRDIVRTVAAVRELGYAIVGEDFSAPNWKEAFVHPKSSHGLLIQIAEWDDSIPLPHRPLADVLADPEPPPG
ncbi:MAG: VOC family protein [Deltaproteobacteria bacterium]|nr:VOC family protein [Deltaproteobacteria bacterium]